MKLLCHDEFHVPRHYMCKFTGMGHVDRRKHDVDVLERVLGGIREAVGPVPDSESTPLCHVEVPWFEGGSVQSTVELTVGLPDLPPEDAPPRKP